MVEVTNPQSGTTPTVGETTKAVTPPTEQTKQPEVKVETPNPDDILEQKIAKLLDKQMYRIKDSAKTTAQRTMEEALRRADLAERKAKMYEGGLDDLDEDSRAKLELRRLRTEAEFYKNKEREDLTLKQREEFKQKLEQSLKDEASSLGLDPTDKRIDYANDTADYFEGRKRFNDSVSKIVKEDRANLEKTLKTEAETRFKQMESDFRKKYGLDSQDTTTSAGVVNQSDADFMSKFGAGDLPPTKENLTRYTEIKNKYYK